MRTHGRRIRFRIFSWRSTNTYFKFDIYITRKLYKSFALHKLYKCFSQQRFERGIFNFHIEECNDLYRSLIIIEKGGKNYYQVMTVF